MIPSPSSGSPAIQPPLRISIVTPSFNHAPYLEATLRSVLDQGYPNLEYIVIDGGSTDGSVGILERFADRLSYWVSEPDRGLGHALNKGFARATGEIMGWINSDDILLPGSLALAGQLFARYGEMEWLTAAGAVLDPTGALVVSRQPIRWTRDRFLTSPDRFIQQESTLWRHSLWERAGAHISEEHLACDYELWARFFRHARLYQTRGQIGAFRFRPGQVSVAQRNRYLGEVQAILAREVEHEGRGTLSREAAEIFTEIGFDGSPGGFSAWQTRDLLSLADRVFLHVDPILVDQLTLISFEAPGSGFEIAPTSFEHLPLFAAKRQREFLFTWLGSGEAEGLRLALHSRRAQPIELCAAIAPGPSRPDPRLTLRATLRPESAPEQVVDVPFSAESELAFSLVLPEGRCRLSLSIVEERSLDELPNGDQRPLLAALADLRFVPPS